MHNARHTTEDDGHQPIAIGRLSDSGILKISAIAVKCENSHLWTTF